MRLSGNPVLSGIPVAYSTYTPSGVLFKFQVVFASKYSTRLYKLSKFRYKESLIVLIEYDTVKYIGKYIRKYIRNK